MLVGVVREREREKSVLVGVVRERSVLVGVVRERSVLVGTVRVREREGRSVREGIQTGLIAAYRRTFT